MFKKQLLYPLLLLASLAHGDAILVMMTEELKPLINPQKMVSPEYDGKVIERVIDIETVFDIREELNSPKNVKTLHNLIQVVDHDNLLDGVILVGDFPMPTPHFSSEPEYEAITEHTGFTSPYADHLYIQDDLAWRKKFIRDKDTLLDKYRTASETIKQGMNTDSGLLPPATGDFEMAELVRSQHPLATTGSIKKSFWISRLTVSNENEGRNTWKLEPHSVNGIYSYHRTLSTPGWHLWGRKYGPLNEIVSQPLFKFFFSDRLDSLPAKVYECEINDCRPNANKIIPWYLRDILYIAPRFSLGANQAILPEARFKLASDWWFMNRDSRSVIFSTTPISHDFLGDAVFLLLENEYQFVGDFYLDLQQRLKKKTKGRILNNLVLFGNGSAHMPKLDLAAINKSLFASLYPDAFAPMEEPVTEPIQEVIHSTLLDNETLLVEGFPEEIPDQLSLTEQPEEKMENNHVEYALATTTLLGITSLTLYLKYLNSRVSQAMTRATSY